MVAPREIANKKLQSMVDRHLEADILICYIMSVITSMQISGISKEYSVEGICSRYLGKIADSGQLSSNF